MSVAAEELLFHAGKIEFGTPSGGIRMSNSDAARALPAGIGIGPTGRTERLRTVLAPAASLAVVCHDNPDPDTIASALGLGRIATHVGVEEVVVAHGGGLSRQENRAMVNTLEIDLAAVSAVDLDAYDRVAFVDHSVPGRNNPVSADRDPDIIIDHHSTEAVTGAYVEQVPSVGATATLVGAHLRELPIDIDDRLATALLFAIQTETDGFARGTTQADHRTAIYLHPEADYELIAQLRGAALTPETLSALGEAITGREVRGSCLVSGVDHPATQEVLPQAAEYLLKLEGVTTTAVYGVVDDRVHLSARTTNPALRLGRRLEEAFGDVGSAGGHDHMAGGQIPLGLIADAVAGGDAVVERTVRRRLFDALGEWADE